MSVVCVCARIHTSETSVTVPVQTCHSQFRLFELTSELKGELKPIRVYKCPNMSFLMCAKEFYLDIQNNAGLLYKGVMPPFPYIVIHRSGE